MPGDDWRVCRRRNHNSMYKLDDWLEANFTTMDQIELYIQLDCIPNQSSVSIFKLHISTNNITEKIIY